MSLYLVAGQGTPIDAANVGEHLPTRRPRRYPSDTSDAEWAVLAPYVPAGTGRAGPGSHRLPVGGATGRFPHHKLVYHYFTTWTRDRTLARMHNPTVALVWADSGYAGKLVQWAATQLTLTVQIVAKLTGQTTFVVLPRRWCVERTFSWINRCRRTVRDYERRPDHRAAFVQWAMIILMARRLARHHPALNTPKTA